MSSFSMVLTTEEQMNRIHDACFNELPEGEAHLGVKDLVRKY